MTEHQHPKTRADLKDLARWKHAELLAHKLPCVLQKAAKKKELPATILVTDEDGKERRYKTEHVEGVHAGIVCFILVPTDPDNHSMHVIFRGTHNKVSAQRNLKANGPGSANIHKHLAKIMHRITENARIINAQKTTNKQIELNIAGHSLGGADAQNTATMILKDLALNPSGELATSIDTLNIIHKNSAGVTANTAKASKAAVEKIKGTPGTKNIDINYYPILIGGDGIQQTGYTSILANMPNTQVNTKMLKVSLGLEGKFSFQALVFGPISTIKKVVRNTFIAHKFKVFDEQSAKSKQVTGEVKLQVFSNATPKGAAKIKASLTNKVLHKTYHAISKMLRSTKNQAVTKTPGYSTHAAQYFAKHHKVHTTTDVDDSSHKSRAYTYLHRKPSNKI